MPLPPSRPPPRRRRIIDLRRSSSSALLPSPHVRLDAVGEMPPHPILVQERLYETIVPIGYDRLAIARRRKRRRRRRRRRLPLLPASAYVFDGPAHVGEIRHPCCRGTHVARGRQIAFLDAFVHDVRYAFVPPSRTARIDVSTQSSFHLLGT